MFLLCPLKDVRDTLGIPLPSPCRSNTACIQRVRNLPERTRPGLLGLPDDWQHIGRVASASAFTAPTAFLRASWSLGLPRVTPRALAAESA